MPSVSVILPTYNRAAFVMEAVESVLAQSFTDLELIVVVDGSEDDTLDRLSGVGDPRLTVLTQSNAGLNAARNAGLSRARGDLVALLDDDDVWLPEKLATQVAQMRAHPYAAFCFTEFFAWRPGQSEETGGLRRWFHRGWFELDETGARMLGTAAPVAYDAPEPRTWHGNLYRSLMVGPLVLPSTAMFRADAIPAREEVFPANDFHCGDWSFFAELSRHHEALFLDWPSTRNRSHEQSGRLSHTSVSMKLSREAAMLERIWGRDAEFLANHGQRFRRRLRGVLLRLAKVYIREGRTDEAREALNRCWRLPGRHSSDELLLGGVLAFPGLQRAVRLLDATRNRLREQ